MTGDELGRPAGYEPGGGYRPAGGGVSLRGFLQMLLFVAAYLAAKWLLEDYFGRASAAAIFNLCLCAVFMVPAVRVILDPERFDESTAEERRRARLWAIAALVVGSVIATLSIQTLFFPE
jgi:hypothetical protein